MTAIFIYQVELGVNKIITL